MSRFPVWRSIRNWPRKFIGLRKTDRKIKQLGQEIQREQREQIAELKQSLSRMSQEISALREQRQAAAPGAEQMSHEQRIRSLNMGETILAAAGIEPNIYSFIKNYMGGVQPWTVHIEPQDLQYFLDFAADFCGKSFAGQHYYSLEFIKQRIKRGKADAFIKELREKFLLPAELDLTANHSISRPFRFWSKQEKEDYIYAGLKAINTLKKISPYCCFGYGTVLAARRGGHFIPHDDDADILLYLPKTENINNRAEAVQYAARFLQEKGCSVSIISHILLKLVTGKTKGITKGIDIFLSLEGETPGSAENAPRADWVPGSETGFALDSIFPPRELTLEGIAIPCPRDAEFYLETVYGKNWRIPDENFHYNSTEWRTE